VRRLLSDSFQIEEAATRSEGLDMVREVGSFDVAIVDMRPYANGSAAQPTGPGAIRQIRHEAPGVGLVAHGDWPERHLCTAALQAGASAYVTRGAHSDELQRAVAAALEHESFVDPAVPPKGSRSKLTRRQRQLLQILARGESTNHAATELELSEETVKTHMKNILARLEARNRAHAVAIALRESLID
jgi:DNA-binding NarL/FixJ family response regulator